MSKPKKYTMDGVEYTAIQYTGKNKKECLDFLGEIAIGHFSNDYYIQSLEEHTVILKNNESGIYFRSKKYFQSNFQLVDTSTEMIQKALTELSKLDHYAYRFGDDMLQELIDNVRKILE